MRAWKSEISNCCHAASQSYIGRLIGQGIGKAGSDQACPAHAGLAQAGSYQAGF